MKLADSEGIFCCQLSHAGSLACVEDKVDIDTESLSDLGEIPMLFAKAAVRAEKAGYDCIQLHAAHGALLSAFISSALNHRTDYYKANNFKMLIDTLHEVRQAVKIPIGIKLNCDDFCVG